jgi:hypothetical protein
MSNISRAGGPPRNCELVLFASAAESAYESFEETCTVIFKGVRCTANCAAKQIIGADFLEFVVNAHKKAATEALKKVARETASKAARTLIPGVLVVENLRDVSGTGRCTVTCVEQ